MPKNFSFGLNENKFEAEGKASWKRGESSPVSVRNYCIARNGQTADSLKSEQAREGERWEASASNFGSATTTTTRNRIPTKKNPWPWRWSRSRAIWCSSSCCWLPAPAVALPSSSSPMPLRIPTSSPSPSFSPAPTSPRWGMPWNPNFHPYCFERPLLKWKTAYKFRVSFACTPIVLIGDCWIGSLLIYLGFLWVASLLFWTAIVELDEC